MLIISIFSEMFNNSRHRKELSFALIEKLDI